MSARVALRFDLHVFWSAADQRSVLLTALALLAALAIAGCGGTTPPRTTFTWVVGQGEPKFDPHGPPDPVREAIERLLSLDLVREDSTGRIAEGAARSWDVTPDGLTYTFHLRPRLERHGGTATSADFRVALEAGLNRLDHAHDAWLLGPVVGVDKVRAGRPLPPLGIATPDPNTLVLRLARADPTMLHRLAAAGVAAWAANAPAWEGGTGPYRVVSRQPGRRMVLARHSGSGPDTIRVEFSTGVARARTLLRRGDVDLLWPVPPGLLDEPLPAAHRTGRRAARPARRLWLVMRADLPPASRPAARRALAHGLHRAAADEALGARGVAVGAWLPGGEPLDLPAHDEQAVQEWLKRGKLGRSMHVVMAFSADGAGAEVAGRLQTEWARAGLDVELRRLRGTAFTAAVLGRGGAQLLLVEAQAPLVEAAAELAMVVEPLRGPPVGGFRTGWRTREFDRWVAAHPPASAVDVELAQRRLVEDLVAIPLAGLPWLWVARDEGPGVAFHPRHGPGPPVAAIATESPHLSR